MKTRLALGVLLVLMALSLEFCSSNNSTSAAAFPTTPKFLLVVDGSGAGTNVNVFPIDATTGALGAAVAGSPFDLGLTDGMNVTVHPNGHFIYVADAVDGSIHSWNVNESTGVPTEIAAKLINESGTFYQPCCGAGDASTNVLSVTPNGNSLYSSNNDATVGAYKINADGSLSHIADLNTGACDTGAIT